MRQGDRRTPDGILDRTSTNDRTVSAYLAYRQGDHTTGIEFLDYDLAAAVPTGDPDFFIDLPKRDLSKTNLFYELANPTPWIERLRLDVHRQTIDREFVNDITMYPGPRLNILSGSVDRQLTWGVSLRAEMRLTEQSRTVVGLEYEDDSLRSNKDTVTTVTIGGPIPPIVQTRLRYDEASIRTTSIFGQHEIDLGRDVTLTLGGRWYDVSAKHQVAVENGVEMPRNSASDRRALASAGLVWQPDEDTALRANISQGYVFPSLSQLFLSTTAGGEGTIIGNPDLSPERATTFELGARRDQGGLLVDATLFYSKANNYIATVVIDPSNTRNVVSQYQNIDTAKTWGLEVHAEYDTQFHGLTPYVTAAALRREFTYANGFTTSDSGTPSMAGRVGVRKSWEIGEVTGELDLFVRAEAGVQLRDKTGTVTNTSNGFGTLNLHASADFGNNVSAVLEFNNITDRRYQAWDEAEGAGRSVNFFLTKTF